MSVLYDKDFYDDKTLTTTEPLRFARIGYDNFVTESNVSASGSLAGFPESSLGNPFTYELWKPPSLPSTITVDAGERVSANYIGIGAHLLSGCEVTLSSSADGATYTELTTAVIQKDTAIMLLTDTVAARYWKVEILGWAETATLSLDFESQEYSLGDYTDSGGAYIGVLYIGQALEMQRGIYQGHTPGTLARQNEIRPVRSEGGQWLGRSVVRRGYETSYEWKNLKAQWYRQNFQPLVEAAVTTPFFIAWRPEGYADEVLFGWTSSDITPTNSGPRDYMSVSMNVSGYGD